MANPFRACAGVCGDGDHNASGQDADATFTLRPAAVMLVAEARGRN